MWHTWLVCYGYVRTMACVLQVHPYYGLCVTVTPVPWRVLQVHPYIDVGSMYGQMRKKKLLGRKLESKLGLRVRSPRRGLGGSAARRRSSPAPVTASRASLTTSWAPPEQGTVLRRRYRVVNRVQCSCHA